MKHSN